MARTNREAPGGVLDLLAPVGTLLALALPFFVLSLASNQAARETKLAGQAAGAVLVLLGLAFSRPSGPAPLLSRSARLVRGALVASLAFFAVSFAAGVLRGRDPFGALPLLPALALAAWGATREGETASRRVPGLLVACGAATGLLAALQRFAGLFRLPVEAPEPRFWATALIGNPGDVGAALVLPALLAAAALLEGRSRLASALGLAACGLGLAAAGTIAPLAAFAAGAATLVAFDLRRRFLPALVAGALFVALLAAAGVVHRVAGKLASGSFATLTTQRDIGFLSAFETIRAHPVLGVGPGAFSSDFVRARLAAEERVGRRLVHRSASAHFYNAHCDPLTVAAEAGLPTALALAAAFALLLGALAGAARREKGGGSGGFLPADVLASSVVAILVLALANFPIQIVPVSGPFALLAGLSLARAGGTLAPPAGRGERAAVAALALFLAGATPVRFAAAKAQASAETALQLASATSGASRRALLDEALSEAERAVALRPRHAPALLALGSARAALGELDRAVAAMERSLALEERAETLLNLGRLETARGNAEAARPFFVRAVWVLPRLLREIPSAGDPDGVVAETRRLEAALAAGGAPPPLPERVRPR